MIYPTDDLVIRARRALQAARELLAQVHETTGRGRRIRERSLRRWMPPRPPRRDPDVIAE